MALTAYGCVAFALPPKRLNPEHEFVTDPWELAYDHIGKHERLPECAGRRLFTPAFRYAPEADR